MLMAGASATSLTAQSTSERRLPVEFASNVTTLIGISLYLTVVAVSAVVEESALTVDWRCRHDAIPGHDHVLEETLQGVSGNPVQDHV